MTTWQFNCVKEMTLPEVAENFQSAGFNVLLYDTRSVGASDGEPRNQPSPYQMAEDISGESMRHPYPFPHHPPLPNQHSPSHHVIVQLQTS